MHTPSKPHIIIVVVDAGRPDYFSCYGYSKATTPNIDSIAKQGVLFKNVISSAPWTIPSHGTMFTSLYPTQHGAGWDTLKLSGGIPTIFDIFVEKGYQPVVVSANSLIVSPYSMFPKETKILGQVPHNDPETSSFTGDFDYKKTSSEKICGCIKRYLDDADLSVPHIVYLNLYDLHAKYKARDPFYSQYVSEKEDAVLNEVGDFYSLHFQEMNGERDISRDMIGALRASYAARLSMIDADLGGVFEKISQKGLFDNSILIITSDHGDVLGDHKAPSFHHQFSIYNSLLKIPLIFYYRDMAKQGIINTPLIQNTDILPTILELCGIETSLLLNDSPGVSLLPYMNNSSIKAPRDFAVSFYESPYRFVLRNKKKIKPIYLRSLFAIQNENYKLIFSDKGDIELYDIKEDPFETRNIASSLPQKVSEFKGAFQRIVKKYGSAKYTQEDSFTDKSDEDKIIKRLKALGYIE